jgi:hypothetical protein
LIKISQLGVDSVSKRLGPPRVVCAEAIEP